MRQTFQEIVQFRKVRLPSSDSYDGSAERTGREFAWACRATSQSNSYHTDHTIAVPADVFRPPITPSLYSYGSRDSDVGDTSWLVDGKWSVTKLLDMSNTMRAGLAEGRKLTLGELEELNFVLDLMVRTAVP